MTVAAIIYGETSGIVRGANISDSLEELGRSLTSFDDRFGIIICDPNDMEWATQHGMNLPTNESMVALVEAKRGKPSDSPLVGVLDKDGQPVGTMLADPAIDVLPDGKMLTPFEKVHYAVFNPPDTPELDAEGLETGKMLPTDVVAATLDADPRFEAVPETAVEVDIAVKVGDIVEKAVEISLAGATK